MKDILAISQTIGTFSPAVHYGADLSRMFEGRLTGLFIVEPMTIPSSFDVAVVGLLEAESQQLLDNARAEKLAFQHVARERGAKGSDWQVAYGPPADAVRLAASWHDLVVIDRANGELADVVRIGQLMLQSALPCVVLPAAHTNGARLDCVTVACNGSPESIRAMHAAIPLLRNAKRVVLLRGRRRVPVLTPMLQPPHVDVAEHLDGHGIRFERRFLDEPEQSTGEEIVGVASEMGADLLVMGAYGRSRISEMLLGGATHHALRAARMPLLMYH